MHQLYGEQIRQLDGEQAQQLHQREGDQLDEEQTQQTGQGTNTTTGRGTNTVDGQGTSTTSRQGSGRGKRGRPSMQGSRRSGGNGAGTTSTNQPTGMEYNSDGSDMMTEDKIFGLYTRAVESPPDDLCPICLESLQEPTTMWGATSQEDNQQPKDSPQESLTLELSQCLHIFHRVCALQLLRHGRSFLECPLCKTIHGVRVGSQPTNGHMKVYTIPDNLPGYPDCGTYVITYIFRGGIQGSEHPNPGEAYIAWAFPRTAYLPANQEGTKVVRLLQEAWKRRLIFRVGRSATTGMDNVITWSDIHHKTNCYHNHNGHGYPDKNHLNNILAELMAVGVSEENIGSTSSS